MSDERTQPGRSIRIERAARAVLTAYDATCNIQTHTPDIEVLQREDALRLAADDLRKELL